MNFFVRQTKRQASLFPHIVTSLFSPFLLL
jgi:hypothetical protein